MNFVRSHLFVCLSVIIILLPGCAGYKSEPIKPLVPKKSDTTKKSSDRVSIAYQKYTAEESKKYLGKDVLEAGYQPIQITIYNNTDRQLLFSPDYINLPCVSADIVSKSVHDSTGSRALGWGITGLFIPVFLIPALVDTTWSMEANQQMDLDYLKKSSKTQTIRSGASLDGIIFVRCQDYKSPFTLTLIDDETQEKLICTLD